MALTNMARSAKERKKDSNEIALSSNGDKFPFGLTVRLDDESLKKLDIKKLPAVGDKVTLAAVGRVESTSERDSARGRKDRDVAIQIEQLEVTNGLAKSAEDAVSNAVKDA